ncbi:hypothetical protein OUZ56_004022 [Daphnia magna]|uniref:Uncharacterized protein n=1 Tax=Daphnia magna TaxID=35525 RepID=A0ABQ9YNI6_9CRUS|nr:hypothetical protein OUZ56_004022 [Daphnia magna]
MTSGHANKMLQTIVYLCFKNDDDFNDTDTSFPNAKGCDYIQARPNNPSVRLDERVTRSNTDANQKGKRTVLILSIHPSSCRMCKPKGGKLDAVRGMQGGSHSSHTRRTESSVSFVSLLEKKELVSKLTIYLLGMVMGFADTDKVVIKLGISGPSKMKNERSVRSAIVYAL